MCIHVVVAFQPQTKPKQAQPNHAGHPSLHAACASTCRYVGCNTWRRRWLRPAHAGRRHGCCLPGRNTGRILPSASLITARTCTVRAIHEDPWLCRLCVASIPRVVYTLTLHLFGKSHATVAARVVTGTVTRLCCGGRCGWKPTKPPATGWFRGCWKHVHVIEESRALLCHYCGHRAHVKSSRRTGSVHREPHSLCNSLE